MNATQLSGEGQSESLLGTRRDCCYGQNIDMGNDTAGYSIHLIPAANQSRLLLSVADQSCKGNCMDSLPQLRI